MDQPAIENPTLAGETRRRSWRKTRRSLNLVLIGIGFLVLSESMIAQSTPTDFDRLAANAASAQDQHDFPRAIALYRQAVQVNPRWSQGWWFLGMLQYGNNDYAGARDALSHYIELSPDAGAAIAVRGLCEFETADYSESLADIQRGLSMGAANQQRNAGILWYHEILLLSHAGKFEDALAASANFARGASPTPEIVMAIGMAGLRVSSLPGEITDDAGQRELFMAAGNAAVIAQTGNSDDTQKAFQELFWRFPTAPNAHYLYGYLLFAKDPDKAIAEFTRELEVNPSNSAAETMLGWASLMREDYPAARQHGEKAVAEAPQTTVAQLVLGRSLVETGNLKAGMEHLEKALNLEPENLEIHLALVRAYSKAARPQDAQRERLRCLELTGGVETAVVQP